MMLICFSIVQMSQDEHWADKYFTNVIKTKKTVNKTGLFWLYFGWTSHQACFRGIRLKWNTQKPVWRARRCFYSQQCVFIHECDHCSHVTGGLCPANHGIYWSALRSGNTQACSTHVSHTHAEPSTPTHTQPLLADYTCGTGLCGQWDEPITLHKRALTDKLSRLICCFHSSGFLTRSCFIVQENNGVAFRKSVHIGALCRTAWSKKNKNKVFKLLHKWLKENLIFTQMETP